MEPNKLEKDFRSKLNQREIAPSEKSWDRLDAMLTVTEKNQPKKTNNWMYVAASLIGFLFIGIVFFSQTEELIDIGKNSVVEENLIQKQLQNDTIIKEEKQILPIVKKVETVTYLNKNKPKNPPALKNPILIKEEEFSTINQNQVALTEDSIAVSSKIVIAESEHKPSVTVDVKQLLSQVDGELELTFREKIVQKVNKNYKAVKVAIANRNQE